MLSSLQTSPFYADLLGDAELAAYLDAAADCGAMISVEVALARAQSQLGVIPDHAGPQIGTALEGFTPDPTVMAAGIASAGVPVPALIAELRSRGLNAIGLFVPSLKPPVARDFLEAALAQLDPVAIVNATAFSGRGEDGTSPLDAAQRQALTDFAITDRSSTAASDRAR